MQVFTAQSLKEKPNNFCVTALGNFDGVHPGHAHLITQAKEYAKKNGYDLCVYTFSEHPSAIKGKKCSLLTTGEEKKELLEMDESYFEIYGYHVIMNHDELR